MSNNNGKKVETFDVKVGGAVVPMTMEQLIANAGRGVLAARDKNYNAPFKKDAKKLEALRLTDEEYQSLLDAKSGNKEAGEFFYKRLVPQEGEEKTYTPIVEEEKREPFDFLSSAKEYYPESYGRFMEVVNGIGLDLYNKINSNQDPYTREIEGKKLYDDIMSGDFNSKIGLAMFESSQSGKDILSSYNDIKLESDNARKQSGKENLGNENTPHSQDTQFYTPDIEKEQYAHEVVKPEGNTEKDLLNDWKQKMGAKFG